MIRLLTARLAPPATAPAPARGDRVPAALAPEPPRRTPRARLRDWAELLRVSALFTVPGDALAGAAAAGLRPNRGTAYAVGASLCLYEAGMALNDWSDREEDGIDRPHRPIPSGRITPRAALTAAGVLTVTGLALAARAGRPALAVATALSATVWAYDLRLKHTPAAPATMAAARGLDLLLGTTATLSAARHPVALAPGTSSRASRRAAAVSEGGAFGPAPAPDASSRRSPRATAVSRPGAPASASAPRGAVTASLSAVSAPALATGGAAAAGRSAGSVPAPAAASAPGAPASASRRAAAVGVRGARPLWSRQGFGKGWGGALPTPGGAGRAATVLAAHTYAVTAVSRHEAQGGSTVTPLAALAATAALGAAVAWPPAGAHPASPASPASPARSGAALLAAVYLRTAAVPYLHAALNPSAPLTQRAVGGGIRAMIPLQAALAARSGAGVTGLAVMGLVPIARRLARKVSVT